MPDALPGSTGTEAIARQYLDALLRGDRNDASRRILEAVEQDGVDIRDIYLGVFQPVLREIGRLWELNRVSVAQEHFCTAATQVIMSRLYPHIFAMEKRGRSLVATCVGGELHEVGIRMVSDFFEMDGWDTCYLGASTPTDAVCRTARDRGVGLVAVSATMTFHLQDLRDMIRAVREDPVTREVPVLVGGTPFLLHPGLWEEVGADGFAADADAAVERGNRLLDRGRARSAAAPGPATPDPGGPGRPHAPTQSRERP